MAIVTKPDMTNAWGEAGSVALPSPSQISLGWEAGDIPPAEVENYIQYRQDIVAKYLYQEGVAEWSNNVEFSVNALSKLDGVLYRCLIAHTNKQPDIEPTYWEIAFDDYGSAQIVQDALDDLLEDDDPFTQYAKRIDPVIIGKATADGFSADVGLPVDNTSEVGYAFDGDSGVFKDGDDIVVAIDAVEKLRVKKTSLSTTDNSTASVTTAWIRNFMQNVLYRVGKLEFTTENVSPASYLGFGTWVRFGEGRAIVGYSSDVTSATPDWVKGVENVEGSYTNTLAMTNLPADGVGMQFRTEASASVLPAVNAFQTGTVTGLGMTSDGSPYTNKTLQKTQNLGDATPVNNVQPSVVVYIWKRVA